MTSHVLFAVAHRILGCEERARDALQESYVNIWSHAAQYRPQLASPMTWMINIVRNRAIDALRAGRQ